MTKKEELQEDTKQLKQLISQVDNSGIAAWDAGKLLKDVKEKKEYVKDFENFENYTKTQIGISPQTANNYITISESFTKEEIGNLMLVTHLKVIAEIKNDEMRKLVLKIYKELEEEKKTDPSSKNIYKTKLSDIIATVTMVLDIEDTELDASEIGDILKTNIEKGKEEEKRKRAEKEPRGTKGTEGKPVFGKKIESSFFGDVRKLMENEPIDEMGVVALFCVMFQLLKVIKFEWKNEIIKFVAIKYVRVRFPDACIRCDISGPKEKQCELDVEFEFQSYNYVRHKHMNSKKNCDLIICWVDDANTDDKLKHTPTVKKLPPVLSLKNCFETGEIKLMPNQTNNQLPFYDNQNIYISNFSFDTCLV